tara:strand:+ start:153 stop:392 length:240 start_codon:yes stop_codon:yes gene_type:complete
MAKVKSIEATYKISSFFDVDIDMDKVENVIIKWDILFVNFKNGDYLEVMPSCRALDNADVKYPVKETYRDAMEQEIEYV